MGTTMRTIGPLHFEDLEPRRFEDLVRQLVYDFRPWRALEATGRGGSDDGFDARGFEIVDSGDQSAGEDPDSPADEAAEVNGTDRIWLIQCKRERTITPAKLRKHLADIAEESLDGLYGVIFAAPCDFSKASYDEFLNWRLKKGLSEGYLWGKANLEDQLYQPKNDNLLFAYFGFSLRIRRRSIKTELRAKLAMKRKSERVLTQYTNVLLLDPTDARYPRLEESKPARWKVRRYIGLHFRGLMVEIYSHYAYVADDRASWDAEERIKNGLLGEYDDPWLVEDESDPPATSFNHTPVWQYWNTLPEKNRANLTVYEVVPFEEIMDIDEKGDGLFRGPIVYVASIFNFKRRAYIENLERWNAVKIYADPELRIKHFPETYPQPEPAPDPSSPE